MKNTIHETAIKVLSDFGQPMSVKEIYDEILLRDLYEFHAERPLDVLTKVIRKHCEGLDFPSARKRKYFQLSKDKKYWLVGKSIPGQSKEESKAEEKIKRDQYTLKTFADDLKRIQVKHTTAFKQQIINQIQQLEPESFERFGKKLLETYGFKKMTVTQFVRDGGIDGHGELHLGISYLNVAFQCKRWKGNVGRVEIDKFRGAIQGEYEQGIIFTTSKFTKDAISVTRKPGAVPIILIDGESLVEFMITKNFGVEIENIPIYINALDNIFNEL